MKKITLFLSVLLMAIVVKAQTEATVTLVHTASSCGDANKDYTSTVDAEKEHLNNTNFGKAWGGAAYAEFSISIPDGRSVKSASLEWTEINSNSKERNTDVMYADAGLTLDYAGMKPEGAESGTVRIDLTATLIETVKLPANKTTTFTTDVTDAVKSIVGAGQSYIIFKFTNNAAGGDLIGKGATEKFPVLTIETADASAMTTYTVKYVDEAGNKIAEDAVYDIAKGETASISDENKAAIWNADKTMKYIYKSCDKESITTVADGASNVITATFREAAICSYTVNAVDGEDNVLKVLGTGSNFEGETVTVPYNQYIFKGGKLYEKSAPTSGDYKNQFNWAFTLSADEMVSNVVYSVSSKTNTVYFSEAESIAGMTATTSSNANIRCSNSTGAYNASETPVQVLTLTPGTYTITAQVWGNSGQTLIISCGSDALEVATVGYITSGNREFTITANTQVVIPQCGEASKCLDWILIQSAEANSLLAVVDGQDFTAAEGTYAAATYTRTVNPAYNYGTICLPFVPNAATLENYTFYGFTATSDGAVTFTEVETPEAYMPYLYSAKDKSATTHTFIGDETEVVSVYEYVNYADVENWEFYGNLEEWYVPDLSEMTAMGMLQYAYKPTDEGEDVLVKATKSLRAKPYRAYFICYQSFGGMEPLATMRIVVRGAGDNGDGTTGIEEVITPDQIEGAAPAIYNLMGQPVAQPVKGQIYIINGKKVVY